jgi:L-rhamnose isomerase/sugar isomerase
MCSGIFPHGLDSIHEVAALADKYGVRPGSINPNLFQDQIYKFGSFGNPDAKARNEALEHSNDSIAIARGLKSRDISFWFADGSNYPGSANIRQRKKWFEECLQEAHSSLTPEQRMLVEYKPFEPAFYHTDIADWGMALLAGAQSGAASESAGRYRPSLFIAKYRADCGLAVGGRHVGRFSF